MRKVFLDELPRGGKFIKDNDINWRNSIGYKVSFIYDDIEGYMEIIEYCAKRQLIIKYDEKIYKIGASELRECKIGAIIGRFTNRFKYCIGEEIKTKTGAIEITHCFRKNDNKKWYKYNCPKCNYNGEIIEYDIKRGGGCSCCWGKTVVKGINDVATTHPHLVKYFVNMEDAYTHTYSSPKTVQFKCLNCGNIKEMSLNNFSKNGLMCNRCSDGRSYCEKFFYNFLEQLNLIFKTQLSKTMFEWCDKYYYDFYFELNGEIYIIETHGRQHYEENTNFKMSLREVQENDGIKKQLALENGIKEENYIIIDCRYSNLDYIKANILKSRLNELFNLSKVDWLKAESYTLSNRVKESCKLKRNNPEMTTTEIGKIIGVNYGAIREYLVRGTRLGWCSYNPKEEVAQINRRLRSRSKPIICIDNGKIFESAKECERQSEEVFGMIIKSDFITRVCRGERNHTKGYHFKFLDNRD